MGRSRAPHEADGQHVVSASMAVVYGTLDPDVTGFVRGHPPGTVELVIPKLRHAAAGVPFVRAPLSWQPTRLRKIIRDPET